MFIYLKNLDKYINMQQISAVDQIKTQNRILNNQVKAVHYLDIYIAGQNDPMRIEHYNRKGLQIMRSRLMGKIDHGSVYVTDEEMKDHEDQKNNADNSQ